MNNPRLDGCQPNLLTACRFSQVAAYCRAGHDLTSNLRDGEKMARLLFYRMGCTQAQFDAYAGDLPEAVAIEVEDPRPYTSPISLVEIERWLSDVPRPPQSYVAVEADDPWGKVLAMVSLLHGSFASSASRRRASAAA